MTAVRYIVRASLPDGERRTMPRHQSNRRTSMAVAVPLLVWSVHALMMHRRLEAARRDPLTGLRTRAGWREQAERVLRAHQADRDQVAVALIDLNGFKQINDTFGHAVGDEVLAAVGRRLTRWSGRHGVIGRLGGDEFVAIVVGTGVSGVRVDLADVLAVIGAPVDISDEVLVRPAASVGVACYAEHPDADLSQLLALADTAMYTAKAAGGGICLAHRQPAEAGPCIGRRGVPATSPTAEVAA